MKDKVEILEEQINIQERLILDLYDDLKFFEDMHYGSERYMRNHIQYSKRKAQKLRQKLRTYINGHS